MEELYPLQYPPYRCAVLFEPLMPRYSHLMPSNEHMMLSITKGFGRELHGFSGIRYIPEASWN